MKYLDIVFFVIARYYKRNKDGYKESSLIATSGILVLNIMTIIFIIEYYYRISILKDKHYLLYIAIPVVVLLYIRYFIIKKEDNVVFDTNKRMFLVLLYIIVSLIICVCSALLSHMK